MAPFPAADTEIGLLSIETGRTITITFHRSWPRRPDRRAAAFLGQVLSIPFSVSVGANPAAHGSSCNLSGRTQ